MHDDIQHAGSVVEPKTFVEGIDFYFEDDLMVLTRKYLLERGFCCESGCRHCPFGEEQPA